MYCCGDPEEIAQESDSDGCSEFQNYPAISVGRPKCSKRVHITVDRREKGIRKDTGNKLYPQGYTSTLPSPKSHLLPLANFYSFHHIPSWVSINWVKLSMSQLPLEMPFQTSSEVCLPSHLDASQSIRLVRLTIVKSDLVNSPLRFLCSVNIVNTAPESGCQCRVCFSLSTGIMRN